MSPNAIVGLCTQVLGSPRNPIVHGEAGTSLHILYFNVLFGAVTSMGLLCPCLDEISHGTQGRSRLTMNVAALSYLSYPYGTSCTKLSMSRIS